MPVRGAVTPCAPHSVQPVNKVLWNYIYPHSHWVSKFSHIQATEADKCQNSVNRTYHIIRLVWLAFCFLLYFNNFNARRWIVWSVYNVKIFININYFSHKIHSSITLSIVTDSFRMALKFDVIKRLSWYTNPSSCGYSTHCRQNGVFHFSSSH